MEVKINRAGIIRFRSISPGFPVDGVVTTKIWPDFSFLKSVKNLTLHSFRKENTGIDSLLFELGIADGDAVNLLRPSLEHGNAVSFIRHDSEVHHDFGVIRGIPGDGIILQKGRGTARQNILLCLSADCPSAVIVAENKRSKREQYFGILHLGWKPLVAGDGIIANAVRILGRHDCPPEKCRVLLTVGIGRCCFEVKEDVLSLFERRLPRSYFSSVYGEVDPFDGTRHSISLHEAAYYLFMQMGVFQRRIHLMPGCTCCSKGRVSRNLARSKNDFLWPSFRRNGTEERFAIAFAV